jgi:hypothetical protein
LEKSFYGAETSKVPIAQKRASKKVQFRWQRAILNQKMEGRWRKKEVTGKCETSPFFR